MFKIDLVEAKYKSKMGYMLWSREWEMNEEP